MSTPGEGIGEVSSSSRGDRMSDLLRQVYRMHTDTLAEASQQQRQFERRCSKLEKGKQELLAKGKDLQRRYDTSLEEQLLLRQDLASVTARLSAPCQSCQLLQQQIQQQEKMYDRVCQMIAQDKDQTLNLLRKQYEDSLERMKEATSKTVESKNDILLLTQQTRHSQISQKLSSQHPSQKSQQVFSQQTKPENEALDDKAPSINADEACIETDLKAVEGTEKRPSPITENRLRLLKANKRPRCRYEEDPLPDLKKAKTSPLEEKVTNRQKKRAESTILAADTCDVYLVNSSPESSRIEKNRHVKNKVNLVTQGRHRVKKVQNRSSDVMVIPETVPFFSDGSNEEEDKENTPSPPTQITVVKNHARLSPAGYETDFDKKKCLRDQANDIIPDSCPDYKNVHSQKKDTHQQNEPGSPVFESGKSLSRVTPVPQSLPSPSLFDDDEVIRRNSRSTPGFRHFDNVREQSNLSSMNESKSPLLLQGSVIGKQRVNNINTSLEDLGVREKVSIQKKKSNVIQKPEVESNDGGDVILMAADKQSPGLSHNATRLTRKSLKQSRLNAASFVPQHPGPRARAAEMNGRLPEDDAYTQHEAFLLEQAKQHSLAELGHDLDVVVSVDNEDAVLEAVKQQSLQELHFAQSLDDDKFDPDMTMGGPQLTSTPCVGGAGVSGPSRGGRLESQFPHPHSPPVSHRKSGLSRKSKKKQTVDAEHGDVNNPRQPGVKSDPDHGEQQKRTLTKRGPSHVKEVRKNRDMSKYPPSDEDDPVSSGNQSNLLSSQVYDEIRISEEHSVSVDNSFDKVPKKKSPDYAHVQVVRKQAERQQLKAYVCKECEGYFGGMDLTDEEKDKRMKSCRHRAKYVPPGTPDHFWEIGFPDTQECEVYMNRTQAKPSNHRRKRGLKQLFTAENESDEEDSDT